VSITLTLDIVLFRDFFEKKKKIAGLVNIASNYLVAGAEASRHGTAHPSIVPYQVFPCKDGFLMVGAGNDKQVRGLRSSQ